MSADGTKPIRSNSRALNRFASAGESREVTLANARRAIQQVASTMRLPTLYVEKAHRLYSRALQMRFMYGRQQAHVVATCLYLICRLEKSPHLLIDFSDTLQVNVYTLGKTYLQFSKLLNLQQQLKVIDPALYLHRFAYFFNLGDKLNAVVSLALRIITRMKKDWIHAGRRPDSICAIAMLLAMKCHSIERSHVDVAKVFRISTSTLNSRIQEFQETPSSQLTVQQFSSLMPIGDVTNNQFNVDDEFDPPSYIRNKVDELHSFPDLELSVHTAADSEGLFDIRTTASNILDTHKKRFLSMTSPPSSQIFLFRKLSAVMQQSEIARDLFVEELGVDNVCTTVKLNCL